MFRRTLFFLFTVLVVPSVSKSQEPLSLADAIRMGLENNYQIRIADKQLDIARRNNNIGTAGLYPSLALLGSQRNTFNQANDPNIQNYNNSRYIYDVGVELNWILFQGFKVYITKSKLDLLEEQTAGNSTIVVENTLQAIILSYYRALVEQQKLRVLQQVLELSSDRYQYESLKKEFGASGTFEELQFKVAYLSDSSNMLLQEINLKNAITELKLLIAADENTSFVLSDTLRYEAKDFQPEDLKQQMLSNNSTLKNQFINTQIFKKEIALQKTSLYPVLSTNAGIKQTFTQSKNFDEAEVPFIPASTSQSGRNYYVNFSLSFNLFNGGNILRGIKNSKVQAEIANLNLEDMQNQLTNQLSLDLDLYNTQKQVVQISNLNLESAALNLNLAEEHFKNGSINSLDYRTIQLDYLNVALKRLEAIYSALESETELLRISGGIIEAN